MKHITQSGRSMVETIGVLAVMGVLTIGGIAGYSYGMDKYRANATINDINLRRIVLLQQANQHQFLNLNEFDEKSTAGYTFQEPKLYDDSVALTIGTLPNQVCEMVLDALFSQTVQIDINRSVIDETTKCGNDNEITFYFPTMSVGSDERGQNGCSLSSPIYNAETDSCELCPDETPVYDTLTQICVECLQDSDCQEDGYYCFGDSLSADFPHYTLCKKISTSANYFGTDLTLVSIGITPDWWNAKKACEAIGMRMPYITDFYPDWNGETDWISLTPKEEYKSMLNYGGIGSWATDKNGNSYMASFFNHIGKYPKNTLHDTHKITCKP